MAIATQERIRARNKTAPRLTPNTARMTEEEATEVVEDARQHWFFNPKEVTCESGRVTAKPKNGGSAWFFASQEEWEQAKRCIHDAYGAPRAAR